MRDVAQRYKLIVCFLPKGKGQAVIEALHLGHGVDAANVTSGRGRALVETVSYGSWVEADTLEVIVPAARAGDIFDLIFELGELGRLHGGLMYQVALSGANRFALPAGLEAETV